MIFVFFGIVEGIVKFTFSYLLYCDSLSLTSAHFESEFCRGNNNCEIQEGKMKTLVIGILLIEILHLAAAKHYTECEMIQELHNIHKVDINDIGKMTCIMRLRTDSVIKGPSNVSYWGIFKISDNYWCSKDGAGGKCNLKCANLIDEDISDDVKCAQYILSTNGVSAWGLRLDDCNDFIERAKECLKIVK